ncbi:Uncharacterised protein [Mycobacteroides abscessus subsp. massiliense]|nr:Uncharacterised protein [Mycobacteroides abscessus subsp. massiliense]
MGPFGRAVGDLRDIADGPLLVLFGDLSTHARLRRGLGERVYEGCRRLLAGGVEDGYLTHDVRGPVLGLAVVIPPVSGPFRSQLTGSRNVQRRAVGRATDLIGRRRRIVVVVLQRGAENLADIST